MIALIVGTNAYVREQEVQRLLAKCEGEVIKVDGETLDVSKLADLVAGGMLFATEQAVIIRGLATNKTIWPHFDTWISRVADTTTLILIEDSVDKRTKAYKTLAKSGTVILADPWTERQAGLAREWVTKMAREGDVDVSPSQADQLVRRAMVHDAGGKTVIDQMLPYQALRSLRGVGKVTDDMIEAVLPAGALENVFALFETALQGDVRRLRTMLDNLARAEEPYKIIGLVSSQWSQLVALALTSRSSDEVARDLGAHPFVLQKLTPYRTRFGSVRLRELTRLLADIDYRLKTTGLDPWVGLERFLLDVAQG